MENTINNIGFNTNLTKTPALKNTQSENLLQQAPSKTSLPSLEQYMAIVGTNYKQQMQISNKFQNNYEYDFNNIKRFKLQNNLEVGFDNCWKNHKVHANGTFTLAANSNKNIATTKILNYLLNQDAKAFSKKVIQNENREYPLRVAFHTTGNELQLSLSCDHSRTKEGFRKMTDFLLHPNFSEDNLKQAKEQVKNNKPIYPSDIAQKFILNGNKTLTDEQINSVSLDEVKTLYNDFLSKAQGKFNITLPPAEYNNSKDDILNSLSKIPPLAPIDKNLKANSLKPLNKSYVIKGRSPSENSKYSKYFVIVHDGSLKEKVTADILHSAFETSARSLDENKKYSPSTDMLNRDCEYYITLGLKSSKATVAELKSDTNALINTLSNKELAAAELQNIKKQVKEDAKQSYLDQYFRAQMLENSYSKGDNTLKSYLDTLDNITPQDIQQSAQKYFSQPYVETIEE